MDRTHRHPDDSERARHQARVDLLIPVLKGWCTELGVEIASLGVQVHGGMGYIEETGACQFLRDARIATIYEGTTGIQAADLVARKLASDGGAAMSELVAQMRTVALELEQSADARLAPICTAFAASVQALEDATEWMLRVLATDIDEALASSVDYLMMTGYVCGGWQMARAALAASKQDAAGEDQEFHRSKLATARFYAEKILPKAPALQKAILRGASGAIDIAIEQF